MEAKVREALAERASADLARARLEQEKQLLEQHNKWLGEELAAKADALLAERRRGSAEEETLRNRLSEVRPPQAPPLITPPQLLRSLKSLSSSARLPFSLLPPTPLPLLQAEAQSAAAKAAVSRAEARAAELQSQLDDAQARGVAPDANRRSTTSPSPPRPSSEPHAPPLSLQCPTEQGARAALARHGARGAVREGARSDKEARRAQARGGGGARCEGQGAAGRGAHLMRARSACGCGPLAWARLASPSPAP